jgi:hypothetical protein
MLIDVIIILIRAVWHGGALPATLAKRLLPKHGGEEG